jgi:hypothetical protein
MCILLITHSFVLPLEARLWSLRLDRPTIYFTEDRNVNTVWFKA